MYKKIELLNKTTHKDLTIDPLEDLEFAKDVRLITLGLSEISQLSSMLPILISGGDNQQFVAFSALSNQDSFFSTKKCEGIYIPMSLRSYPFIMVDSHEEGNEERMFRAVGLDVQSDLVGEGKTHKLFEEEGKLAEFAARKVQLVQNYDKDKLNSARLINKLKEYDLLDKRSFDIKIEDGSTKTLLSDFYVVNRERLYNLEDAIILEWAKSGWLFVIESHMKSIDKINTLLQQIIKKDEE